MLYHDDAPLGPSSSFPSRPTASVRLGLRLRLQLPIHYYPSHTQSQIKFLAAKHSYSLLRHLPQTCIQSSSAHSKHHVMRSMWTAIQHPLPDLNLQPCTRGWTRPGGITSPWVGPHTSTDRLLPRSVSEAGWLLSCSLPLCGL